MPVSTTAAITGNCVITASFSLKRAAEEIPMLGWPHFWLLLLAVLLAGAQCARGKVRILRQ